MLRPQLLADKPFVLLAQFESSSPDLFVGDIPESDPGKPGALKDSGYLGFALSGHTDNRHYFHRHCISDPCVIPAEAGIQMWGG
jgi:hypothetical protein